MSPMHPADPFRTNRSSWDARALQPRRYSPNPDDIDLDPPPIEHLLASAWRRSKPVLARWARLLRRNIVILAGLVTAVVMVAHLRAEHQRTVARAQRAAREAELLGPATRDVEEILGIIGHGVKIARIRFDSSAYATAWYRRDPPTVTINLNLEWEPDDMLATLSHECVHALFDHAGLSGYRRSLEHQLVEETAAEVLGAHIAGQVVDQRGGRGKAVTRRLVAEHRALCTAGGPSDIKLAYARRILRDRSSGVDYRRVWGLMSHFGNERFVDEVDEICTGARDPWAAAHEIAQRYKLHYTWHPAEIPGR